MKKHKAPKSNPPYYSPDQPADELTAKLAYSIWEREGRPDGRAEEHWLQAEAQIRMCRLPNLG